MLEGTPFLQIFHIVFKKKIENLIRYIELAKAEKVGKLGKVGEGWRRVRRLGKGWKVGY